MLFSRMIGQQIQRNSNKTIRAKPFSLHCCLLFFIFVYAFFGGVVFRKLEMKALEKQRDEQNGQKIKCVTEILSTNVLTVNEAVDKVNKCWTAERDERSEWGYMTATLYGFGIITTLGNFA
ncbi:hypothetical protein L596_021043 [Steinernema carpocapsae]|uniref:Potassium channel domain-containing protein n=1 Tax=Steinernema carpocapsae TaxID=34508 RepID=A0A4U5MVD1_STECR|nr:hypothetical protein L596_021043 [Steinernema carpocapsae]